jgi:Peptidase inhibitor I78 family
MGEEGVRLVVASVMAAALMACAAPAANQPGPVARVDEHETAIPPQTAEDSCGLAGFKQLVGVAEAEIDRAALPQGARVICFGCMATMDYAPGRLNLRIGPDHKVASLSCG